MTETKTQKDITSVKDSIKDKVNKLAAAVYLVTNFLDDLEQIKWKLRHKSLELKDILTLDVGPPVGGLTSSVVPSVWPVEIILSDISEIISLIDIAVLDRHASLMNFSILRQGYLGLQTEFQNYMNGDWYKQALIPISVPTPQLINQSAPILSHKMSHKDQSRRDKIISFIKQHNWSSTKDVAKSTPGVGSKTIQRELAELVKTGVLKKEGDRRWSRYNLN